MRIKHRFSFNVNESTKEIVEFLSLKKMKYEIINEINFLSFEIYEDNENWDTLNVLIRSHDIASLSKTVFTKKEILDSDWLSVSSKWVNQYPQPEVKDGYVRETFDIEKYCNKCGGGLTQKDAFMLKKTPKWGKRNILSLHWIEDEIFVTEKVEEELVKKDLKGFCFKSVKKYKKNEILDNIKQLMVLNTLNQGMNLDKEDITKEIVCSECGSKKYVLSGRTKVRFNRDIFNEDYDIVKTYEEFGDGLVSLRMILISQKFYRVLQELGWHKDLIVEPIELI